MTSNHDVFHSRVKRRCEIMISFTVLKNKVVSLFVEEFEVSS